jgi:hypothetical protein
MNEWIEKQKKITGKSAYHIGAYVAGVKIIDKKCPFGLFIPRLKDEFYLLFQSYFAKEGFNAFRAIGKEINYDSYSTSKIGVTSRVLNHWLVKNVSPVRISVNNGEWKSFSLVEAVWLRSVIKMREFGLSLEKIAKVRSWVLQWDNNNKRYPWFEFYVFLAWCTPQDPYIAILPDGTAELATSLDLERVKQGNKGVSEHLLLISLKAVLAETGFVGDVKKLEPLKLLDEDEKELLSSIRESDVKEVRAHVRRGWIKEIETTQVYPRDINITEINKEIENSKEYAEVLTRHSKGTKQSIEVVKKRRIK